MAAGASDSAAAAEEARRQRQEEEEMTNYSRDDLAGDWEFKIVRSVTAAFRNPAVLEKLRQDEAQAGWVMVEKFDDARIRFKRAASARENDFRLPQGVDPYRTYYGISNARFSLVLLLIIFGGIGLMFLLILIPIFLYLPDLMR
jgi:hypothetical protein